ncbi:MAG: response regulator [Chitinivibrionales bacterium]|nr:response regulator [Chitinivibrionales bacterium]
MYRVLLADDDHFCLRALKKYLGDIGCNVSIVDNGNDAFEVMQRENFDLFIGNYHLPGKSCERLIPELRARGWDTPSILMTGDITEETERNARQLSPVFFFVKPINLPDLKAVVYKVLEKDKTTAVSNENVSGTK